MKITGLVTCVGEHYVNCLSKSLPIWRETLDEIVIVTNNHDAAPSIGYSDCLVTDIFTAHGASFNKGAALSQGFASIKDPDWILNFDADILPPANWREIVERCVSLVQRVELLNARSPNVLYGCSHRYREDGSLIPDADFPNIWGFFHLWNVADPHSWKRPVYDPTCGHAGNYDHTFMCQWPPDSRVDLWPELKLVHQGEPRQKWFGNDEKNDRKMINLFTLGLYDAWLTRAGHIKPPPPQVERVCSKDEFKDLHHVMWFLQSYNDPDPFLYKVEIK